jgi:hypothetical protein
MIMEFLDKAARHLIAVEKGLIREEGPAKHTHTLTPKIDDILLLKGRLIQHFGLEDEERYPPLPKRKILDAIKVVEGLKDDRPARDRLGVLLSRGLCIELNHVRGMTKPIKFKSEYEDIGAVQEEIKRKEADLVVAKWACTN